MVRTREERDRGAMLALWVLVIVALLAAVLDM